MASGSADKAGRPAQFHSESPQAQGVAAELALLAQLRDQGVVTQDEFEEQKAKLLGGWRVWFE